MIEYNTEIQAAQQSGVAYSVRGKIIDAEHYLLKAKDEAESSYSEWETRSLHTSAILRDLALNAMRGAVLRGGDPGLIQAAENFQQSSQARINSLVASMPENKRSMLEYSAERRKKYFAATHAEAGATTTAGFRILSFKMLKQSSAISYLPEAREIYNRAFDHLLIGNNSYFGANNAMHAARFERVFGSNLKAIGQLGWAAYFTCRSILQDNQNFLPSVKTIAARVIDLTSKEKARNSFTRISPRIIVRGQIVNI